MLEVSSGDTQGCGIFQHNSPVDRYVFKIYGSVEWLLMVSIGRRRDLRVRIIFTLGAGRIMLLCRLLRSSERVNDVIDEVILGIYSIHFSLVYYHEQFLSAKFVHRYLTTLKITNLIQRPISAFHPSQVAKAEDFCCTANALSRKQLVLKSRYDLITTSEPLTSEYLQLLSPKSDPTAWSLQPMWTEVVPKCAKQDIDQEYSK